MQEIISNDKSLVLENGDLDKDEIYLNWHEHPYLNISLHFDKKRGVLETYDSNFEEDNYICLTKYLEIAKHLNARLMGEEGELYTEVPKEKNTTNTVNYNFNKDTKDLLKFGVKINHGYLLRDGINRISLWLYFPENKTPILGIVGTTSLNIKPDTKIELIGISKIKNISTFNLLIFAGVKFEYKNRTYKISTPIQETWIKFLNNPNKPITFDTGNNCKVELNN